MTTLGTPHNSRRGREEKSKKIQNTSNMRPDVLPNLWDFPEAAENKFHKDVSKGINGLESRARPVSYPSGWRRPDGRQKDNGNNA